MNSYSLLLNFQSLEELQNYIFTSYETIDFVDFDYESRINFLTAIEGSYELTIEGRNDFSNKARFLTNSDFQKELLQYF